MRLEHARLATTGAHATIDAVVPIALVADRLPERLVHAFGSPPVVPKATLSADVAWALDDSGLLTAGSVPVHGSVEGRVELESDRLEVNAIRGTGIVRAAELAVGTSRLTQAGEGRIAIADGRVTLAPWRLSGAGTDLVAEGSVVIGSDGDVPVAATVRGPIVLEPLQALLGIPISGVLTSDVRVGGTVSQPRLDGTLAVTGGALRIRTPRVALADVAESVRLTGTSAVVDSVSGLVNGAPFTLDGAVALPGHPGAEPRSLRLRAERVPIQPFANGPRAEADLDLVYREKPGERLVTGSADLLPQPFRGSVLALKQFVDTVAAANAPLGETPRRKAGTSPVKLEIAVNSREPLLVDTNVGRVELAAKLTIAGSTDQPSLLGRVTILEDGVIRAGGRTYTISSGTIDFNNPRRVVPLINLTATTKISTYAITMVLAVRRSAPDQPYFGPSARRERLALAHRDGAPREPDRHPQQRRRGTAGRGIDLRRRVRVRCAGDRPGRRFDRQPGPRPPGERHRCPHQPQPDEVPLPASAGRVLARLAGGSLVMARDLPADARALIPRALARQP